MVTVARELAIRCITIRNMLEDTDGRGTDFPLPLVDAYNLQWVLSLLETCSSTTGDRVAPSSVQGALVNLLRLASVVNFLDVPALLDVVLPPSRRGSAARAPS